MLAGMIVEGEMSSDLECFCAAEYKIEKVTLNKASAPCSRPRSTIAAKSLQAVNKR